MIVFKRLLSVMKARGKTWYSFRVDKVVGQETIRKLKAPKEDDYVDTRTISSLCKYLHCQPRDIMEYMADEENSAEAIRKAELIQKSSIVTTLHGMIARCYNTKTAGYKYYGGKGITVCDEWLDKENGKQAFVEWALSHGWKAGLTIDRIDSNKGYSPDNCRWITRRENSSRAHKGKPHYHMNYVEDEEAQE